MAELFYKARKFLGEPQKSVVYFGTSERGTSDRIHAHTLGYITHRSKASESNWIEALVKHVQTDLVDAPKQDCGILLKNIELVRDSEAAAAYITKQRLIRDDSCLEHHSGKSFIDFAEKFRAEKGQQVD